MDDGILMQISGVGVIFTIITTLAFNIIVILAYIMMKKQVQQKAANIFLVNQAVADISSVIPSMIWSCFAFGSHYYHLDRSYKILFLFTSFVIIGSLLVTSLDRFFHVKSPIRHHKVGGKFQVMVAIVVAWAIPVIPSVTYALYVESVKDEFEFAKVVFTILLLFVMIIIILLILTFFTLRASIHQHITDMSTSPAHERKEEEINEERAKERRLVIILFLMVFANAATILPHIIVVLISLHYEELNIHKDIRFWQRITFMAYTFSTAIDPLLTIFLRSDFRQAKYWLTLKRCFLKGRDDEDENDATMLSTSM